jgi:hypothetical protein
MRDRTDEATTFVDALRSAEFWMLLTGALAAGFGVSAWFTVPAVAAGLLISSLSSFAGLYSRAREVGALGAFWLMVGGSLLNAVVASAAATIAGRLIWWAWGL